MRQKEKILVVDDEEIIVLAFEEELKEAGYEVKTALSGEHALKLIAKERFDMVYTNLLMPEMNGIEVCKFIKQMVPQTKVVLITGSPIEIEENYPAFVEVGGDPEILRKPLSEGQLVSKTRQFLGGKGDDQQDRGSDEENISR